MVLGLPQEVATGVLHDKSLRFDIFSVTEEVILVCVVGDMTRQNVLSHTTTMLAVVGPLVSADPVVVPVQGEVDQDFVRFRVHAAVHA